MKFNDSDDQSERKEEEKDAFTRNDSASPSNENSTLVDSSKTTVAESSEKLSHKNVGQEEESNADGSTTAKRQAEENLLDNEPKERATPVVTAHTQKEHDKATLPNDGAKKDGEDNDGNLLKAPQQEKIDSALEDEYFRDSVAERHTMIDRLLDNQSNQDESNKIVQESGVITSHDNTNDSNDINQNLVALTSSTSFIAPPEPLQRRPPRPISTPGAFPVAGIGQTQTNNNDVNTSDGGDVPATNNNTNNDHLADLAATGADVLVEAHLVGTSSGRSSSTFHVHSSRSDLSTPWNSSSRRRRRSAPVLAHAQPLEEGHTADELTWYELLTNRKVASMLIIVVIVTLIVGISVGVTRNRGDDESSDISGELDSTNENNNRQTRLALDVEMLPASTAKAIQEDPTSPQARANQWMLQDRMLTTYSVSRKRQRFALATLYYATRGKEWRNSGNWLNYSVHECEWGLVLSLEESDDIVFANSTTEEEFLDIDGGDNITDDEVIADDFGVERLADDVILDWQCTACPNEDGIYRQLILSSNQLAGTLPVELLLLMPELEVLNLSANPSLVGTLRSEVGLLERLQDLSFNDCGLTGSIPTEVGNLLTLSWLDMSLNLLNQSIPTEIGRLKRLQYLILDVNELVGPIPSEVGSLNALTKIYLSQNFLTGTVPAQINNLNRLVNLEIYNNRLAGRLPDMTNLTKLAVLGLDQNDLTGTIATHIGLNTRLQVLHLYTNLISGTIPSEIGELGRMEELLLSNNNLSGTLPTTVGQVESLYTLDVYGNPLVGTIPSELGLLENLFLLDVGETLLIGTVPSEVCDLQSSGGYLEFLLVDCSNVGCC